MSYSHQQVITQLGIDIELFLRKLEAGLYKKPLAERDQEIVCQFLLGYRRKQVAATVNLCDAEVGNRLNANIYPRIAELMQVEQSEIANNWVLILNFLLNPVHGYRLNPSPQLNSDNFQGSFGRQIFLYSNHQKIVQNQIKGSQRYQQGLYYQALLLFVKAWNEEHRLYGKGNPEICIYINNCLIEYRKTFLKKQGIQVYSIAVIVPFHHNQGRVAAEILRGIAQIQSQINFQNFDISTLETEFCEFIEHHSDKTGKSRKDAEFTIIRPNIFSMFREQANLLTSGKIALQVMVVNDPNNVYDPYNQTAEKLANLAAQLDLIAVIGHYSSEMTRTALNFYAEKGIVLINASSTSSELSDLDENIGFFRVTTPDRVNAAQLIQYLVESIPNSGVRKVAIIYNEKSSYSCSYRAAIKARLDNYQNQFVLQSEYGRLGGEFDEIRSYLLAIRQESVNVIILIPDGGIEPNSLNNAGLISRLNLKDCVIAGSATFYQENVLHWMHERSQRDEPTTDPITHENSLIACIPWHWHSQENGCKSSNLLAKQFCQIGKQLWGIKHVTWRSATAFDSILILLKALEHSQEDEMLVQMRRFFKIQNQDVTGVTGVIKFRENGDRISPPAEIVGVQSQESLEVKQKGDEVRKQWGWEHLKSMPK
ncbi:hypothetical protein C7B76_11200 [filamentous cyanobacterium CCP2]|nr:hypothetical protein C7B76_11200 [filamentous cyanobacterium CCP2]